MTERENPPAGATGPRRGRPTGRPYGVIAIGIVVLASSACGQDSTPAAPPAGAAPTVAVAPPAVAPTPPPAPPHVPGTLLKAGDPAPDFRVKDQTERERTLAEFRGKRVVLWFFPKAATPG